MIARRTFSVRHSAALAALLAALLGGACAGPDGAGLGGAASASRDGSAAASGASPSERSAQAAPGDSERRDGSGANASDQAAADEAAEADEHAGGSPAGENIPQVELSQKLLFQLLAAEIAAQRGQINDAPATYLSMARETRDPRLARRAAELALGSRALQPALAAAQLWHELSPDSPMATQTLEALWLTTGRLDEAEPLLAKRLERARADKQLPDAYNYVQRALSRSPDRGPALDAVQRLAAPDRQVAAARLAVAAIAQLADKPELALSEADAALKLEPRNEQAAIAAAQYAAQTKDGAPKAIAQLQSFVRRQPKALEARFTLARLLAAADRPDDARAQFEAALEQEPDSPAILFSMAQLAYQTKQLSVAQDYLRRYLALPAHVQRDNNPAYLFLGQIAEDTGRGSEALDWYAQVRRGEQFMPALLRRAVLMGKLGQVDQARELLRSTSVSRTRERAQLTSAEAQVLREAKRDDEAFEVLSQGLQSMPENAELLYDHAMAAERLGKLDVMETGLRKLIELRPDYAHAYNALGYTLADRNIRLDEAQQLIEKALELSPSDAHILDSMGWVLYRRGDYQRAIEYLEKAYQQQPEAEIAAHLGEVLWHAGRTDEARQRWLEARQRDPANAVLKETLARLNVAL
ncbi:MAG: tetratricopeptide repeat protein [Burkholderiaceae bacterium]